MTNKEYRKKVVAEFEGLEEKIENLDAFWGTEKFHKLNDIQRVLLIVQKSAMDTYATCLNERLNNW